MVLKYYMDSDDYMIHFLGYTRAWAQSVIDGKTEHALLVLNCPMVSSGVRYLLSQPPQTIKCVFEPVRNTWWGSVDGECVILEHIADESKPVMALELKFYENNSNGIVAYLVNQHDGTLWYDQGIIMWHKRNPLFYNLCYIPAHVPQEYIRTKCENE